MNGRADLVHRAVRGGGGTVAEADVALDILDHHDRVVDHDADRQHQAEEGQHVEREAEPVEHGERADQRHRDGDDRNDRHAPGLQEDDDDDDHQRDGLEDRLVDLVDRFGDELGRVVDDVVGEARREILGELGDRRLDLVGRRERVGARPLEDAERHRLLAVEIGVGDVVLGAKLDARDVLQRDQAAVLGRLDDDIAEVARVVEAALRGDRVLEGGAGVVRRRADRAARDLHVLLAQRLDDVARRHAERRELLRVEPDAQRIFALAEDDQISDAVEAQQDVAHARARVVGDIELVVCVVRRQHMNDHHQVGRTLVGGDALPAHLLGQPRLGDRNPVLHQHLRLVEVGAELEGDGELHRAVARRIGGHVEHVLDAVDLLLDRRRDGCRDGLGVGARIDGGDDDGRRRDLGILRDRQLRVGDGADDQEHDRQHRCEDRPVDEEMREAHCGAPASSASGGSVTTSALTLTPGLTRISPLMMTVSSPVRPFADDAVAVRGAGRSGRAWR